MRTNPALFFFLGFLLFCFGFFFAVRDRFFAPETRAIVFAIDPRMDQDSILRVKSILKMVSKEVSCSFGLSSEQGLWLAPVSEDRVFFLLQLEQVVPENSTSSAPFIPNRSDFPKGSLLVVFSPFGSAVAGTNEAVLFQPASPGTWTMISGREKSVVETSSVAERIRKMTVGGGEQTYSYGLVEQELYGLLLLLALLCIWRYRRALPWLICGVFMISSPLYAISEVSVLSALVTTCGEKELATKYLVQKYLTDVSPQNRAVYAYNLALISARFGNIQEALSWTKLLDNALLNQREVREFVRDLLSTLILQGDTSFKNELRTIVLTTDETALSKAALLFQPNSSFSHNCGLDEGVLQVASPAFQFLPLSWQKEMEKEMRGEALEQALISKSLASLDSSWEKIEFLIRIGFREARLYSLLSTIQSRQEQTGFWMKDQVIEYAKKGVADSRVKEQVIPSLFQKAWDQGKSLCERWERCWYLVRVVRPAEESPWVRALVDVQFLGNKKGALNLALEAFFATIPTDSGGFDTEFSAYLDNFLSVTRIDITPKECDAVVSSLASLKDAKILPLFFQKSTEFLKNEKGMSALELLSVSMMMVDSMASVIDQLNPDQVVLSTVQLAGSISQKLHDQVSTKQEQELVEALSSLKDKNGPVLEILEKTYDILAELEYLFKERNIELVPDTAPIGVSPQEFFINKDDAIQLLIQLEQEEHALEKRVK